MPSTTKHPLAQDPLDNDGYAARLASALGFSLESLEYNRRGELAPAQRTSWRRSQSLSGCSVPVIVMLIVFLALSLGYDFTSVGQIGSSSLMLAGVSALLIVLSYLQRRNVTHAAPTLKLYTVEGHVTAVVDNLSNSEKREPHFIIGELHFPVSNAALNLLDDTRRYRIYYVTASYGPYQLVSMEPVTPRKT